MKIIEFDYRQEHLRTGKIVFRPVAKVYLFRSGSEWIAEYFYIDSGADYTLIPYRMGRFCVAWRKVIANLITLNVSLPQ